MIIDSPTHTELLRMFSFEAHNPELWAEFFRRFHMYICSVVKRELLKLTGTAAPEVLDQMVEKVYLRLIADSAQAMKTYRGREQNSLYLYLEIIAIRTVINNIGIRH